MKKKFLLREDTLTDFIITLPGLFLYKAQMTSSLHRVGPDFQVIIPRFPEIVNRP